MCRKYNHPIYSGTRSSRQRRSPSILSATRTDWEVQANVGATRYTPVSAEWSPCLCSALATTTCYLYLFWSLVPSSLFIWHGPQDRLYRSGSLLKVWPPYCCLSLHFSPKVSSSLIPCAQCRKIDTCALSIDVLTFAHSAPVKRVRGPCACDTFGLDLLNFPPIVPPSLPTVPLDLLPPTPPSQS